MKQFLIAVGLLLLSASIFAQDLRVAPNTVGEMTAQATLQIQGTFEGTLSSQDEMTIKVLMFSESESQEILASSERLVIGNTSIQPEHETDGENRYAIFRLTNLVQYVNTPRFDVYVNATIHTKPRLGLGNDYNLAQRIQVHTPYLASSRYIESNDETLSAKASLEFQSDSELDTIREITQWVNTSIRYDREPYYTGDAQHPNGVWSAVETYQNRAGVCDEFANLTAAFLRIKGIPARYVSGISFDGTRFGNHGWIEAYLPGSGWIGVDSTYGEAGYVDAMHLALGRGVDQNQIRNVVITTRSANAIRVNAKLLEPHIDATTLSYEKLSGLTHAEINAIPELKLSEPFQIRVQIQNKTTQRMIIPVELALHPDFQIENETRLELFEPNQTKTVSWNARSPGNGKDGFLTTYGLELRLPDQTIEDRVTVKPENFNAPLQNTIQITEVNPLVENQKLTLVFTIENKTNQTQTIQIELTQGTNSSQKEFMIPSDSVLAVSTTLENTVPGPVQARVLDGIEKTYSFSIPEKPQDPIIVQEEPNDEPAPIPIPESTDFFAKIWNAIARFFQSLLSGATN